MNGYSTPDLLRLTRAYLVAHPESYYDGTLQSKPQGLFASLAGRILLMGYYRVEDRAQAYDLLTELGLPADELLYTDRSYEEAIEWLDNIMISDTIEVS